MATKMHGSINTSIFLNKTEVLDDVRGFRDFLAT